MRRAKKIRLCRIPATGLLALGLGLTGSTARAGHSAHALWAQDQVDSALSGTSNPVGTLMINYSGSSPGFLNNIFNQSIGSVSLAPPSLAGPTFVGVAIHVTDSAGASHSLADLNDPALNDILADLAQNTAGDLSNVSAYAYSAAPAQYAGAKSILSAGELADGGQPFDFLIVGGPSSFQPPVTWLSLGFDNEIGNLDGISALSITDIGAVPEPSALLFLLAPALLLPRRRPR